MARKAAAPIEEPEVGGASPGSEEAAPSAEEQLRTELAQARERIARAEGELEALRRQPAAPATQPVPPKDFTRAELRQAVDAGTITEEKMDEILEQQMERRVSARAAQRALEQVTHTQSAARIQADLDRYLERLPDLQDKSSGNRQRVQREYDYLLSIGATPGAATELAALRSVFGPPERIPEKRAARERGGVETLGANDGAGDESEQGSGWERGLNARQITHYRGALQRGLFRGDDDPRFLREIAVARGGDARKLAEKARQSAAGRTH